MQEERNVFMVVAQYNVNKDEDWKAFVASAKLSELPPEGVSRVFPGSWTVDTDRSATWMGEVLKASGRHEIPIQAFRLHSEKPVLKQNC